MRVKRSRNERLGERPLQHGRARRWKQTNSTCHLSTIGNCQNVCRFVIFVLVAFFSRINGNVAARTSAKYRRAKTAHLPQEVAMALVLVGAMVNFRVMISV